MSGREAQFLQRQARRTGTESTFAQLCYAMTNSTLGREKAIDGIPPSSESHAQAARRVTAFERGDLHNGKHHGRGKRAMLSELLAEQN